MIEDLYLAFSGVEKANLIGGCTLGCCMTKVDRETLLSGPLREADAEILWFYPGDAIWTVGSELDFKYFVPRLLELGLSEYQRDGHSQGFIAFPETFGKKLALAGFDDWPLRQRETASAALLQIMKNEVLRGDFYNASGWLNAVCHLSLSKVPYLEFLDSIDGQKARDYFLLSVRGNYSKKGIAGPFWNDLTAAQTETVVTWLSCREEESNQALSRKRKTDRKG